MNRGVRRRLDALIVICSSLLGVVLTYLFLSHQTGVMFLLYAFFPTAILVLLALLYVKWPSAGDTEGRIDG